MFFFQMGFQAVNQRPIADYPLQPISRPCSIEKSISSRMANRYTRIFDAGGQARHSVFSSSVDSQLTLADANRSHGQQSRGERPQGPGPQSSLI